MSKDIAVIDPASIPAYAINPDRAKALNAAAMAGLTSGGVASIRIKNGKFRIKEPNVDDVVLKPDQLAKGMYLSAIIVGIREPMNKAFFAKPYDPTQDEPSNPDCFSFDGIAPDKTVKNPIAPNCAGCPNNAFNTGKNARGEATKGKACSDAKVMALYVKLPSAEEGVVYQFKVPPASLKNLATYLRELDRHGVAYPHVLTFIGFDDDSEYPVLTFQVGMFIPVEKYGKVEELMNCRETYDIMHPVAFVQDAPKQVAAPAEDKAETGKGGKGGKAAAKPKDDPAPVAEPEEAAAPVVDKADDARAPSAAEMDALMGL